MEQYLNLVWKNYTASLSRNSDENLFDEDDDASDIFVGNDLHYKIPFWIGVIVISLLFLSAIIATIRYCIYTLCSSHNETEKMALMPPKSPCLSSNVTNRIQCQKSNSIRNHSSDDLEQTRDIHQYSRSNFSSTRHHQTKFDSNDFPTSHITSSRVPVDFQKKIHDIYVLPVSPALSSSSSTTTNTNEIIKSNSNTMPIRSPKHLSSLRNNHGIKNHSFADSPQPKNRTLPRSHLETSRTIQPPSQPPPLPPTFEHRLSAIDLNSDATFLHFNTIEEIQIQKTQPPPVPSRTQKPSMLPIGFEELTKQSNKIGFRYMTESSLQNDYSEQTWPNPPEFMSTSQITRPLSIPYDHLIPTIIMHENNTANLFHPNSMLTESES